MNRGKSTVSVKAESGIVEITAEMPGSTATLRVQPDMAFDLAMRIIEAGATAEKQVIEARP